MTILDTGFQRQGLFRLAAEPQKGMTTIEEPERVTYTKESLLSVSL